MSRSRGPWVGPLLGVVGGVMQALSMGLPHHLGPSGALQWCAMLVLATGVIQSLGSIKRVAGFAFVFQCTALLATVWWLFIALHVYGEMPIVLSVFGLAVLCGGLALYWAGFAALYAFLVNGVKEKVTQSAWTRTFLLALGFGASWTLSELARGVWFTGFPWGSSGYAHTDTWLGQLAAWGGVYTLGWVSASLAMGCVLLATHTRKGHKALAGVLALAMLLSLLGWPVTRTDQPTPRPIPERGLSVSLLQGNVPQDSQLIHAREDGGVWYRDQIARSSSDLVITPETAFAKPPQAYAGQFFPSLVTLLLAQHRMALIGMPLLDGQGYTNSAVGVGESARDVYRYDKSHLVPFGEFVPPMFKWFTDQLSNPLGFFRHGDTLEASWSVMGERIAPNICYEDLFGEELAKRFVQENTAPTLLVNMSNIAWFGDTVVIDQHIQIARMRTLELHRPMLRSTNAGATMVIDENARVLASLPSFTQGILTTRVSGVHEGVTFFAWWAGRFGLWPVWLGALGALLLLAWRGHTRPSR